MKSANDVELQHVSRTQRLRHARRASASFRASHEPAHPLMYSPNRWRIAHGGSEDAAMRSGPPVHSRTKPVEPPSVHVLGGRCRLIRASMADMPRSRSGLINVARPRSE